MTKETENSTIINSVQSKPFTQKIYPDVQKHISSFLSFQEYINFNNHLSKSVQKNVQYENNFWKGKLMLHFPKTYTKLSQSDAKNIN